MGVIMPLNADISNALVLLEHIQSTISQSDDAKLQTQTNDDLNLLINFLENPIFRGVATIQDSLNVLSTQIQQHPSILPIDFDVTETGDLVLNLPPTLFEPDFISTPTTEVDDQRVPVAKLSQSSSGEPNSPPIINQSLDDITLPPITTPTYALEFQKAIDESSQGRDVITVKLYKPEGCSLGFSVVGLRSEEKGELGIFIQEIQINGIAGRDGRLHEGDQILAIDGQPLDSNISHEQAISILQKARGLVELVLARSEEQPPSSLTPSPSPSPVSDTSKAGSDMVLNTEWAQVEVIDLINDGSGLGFGIIGGRSTGVVVKTILPGGVADRNGRLQSGDHILQIGDVNLRGMGSEQVAAVLRQSGSHVRLVVARPVEPTSPDYQALGSHAPIVPTKILADPEELDRHLVQNGYPQVTYNTTTPTVEPYDNPFMFHQDGDLQIREQDPRHLVEVVPGLTPPHLPLLTMDMLPLDTQLPEMERFTVELKKDIQGLGITIAGYVCEKEELSGIFVKSISTGSAADLCKKIQVNDRIVEVDGQSLQGYTNHDAVEVLRSTGGIVRLSLERYLRGPKFEQLQLAIANSELKPPTPSSPSAISLPRYPISVDGESAEIEVEGESITTVDSVILNEANNHDIDLDDVDYLIDQDFEGPIKPSVEVAIKKKWSEIMGSDVEIVVGQLNKFGESKGLGISLEGTVDVEDGQEVRPHHYIRSILPEGPVGQNGKLRSGDELLEVNGHRLLGMNHIEVVTILKELPVSVRMVCARRIGEPSRLIDTSQDRAAFATRSILGGSLQNLLPAMERLVKAKSDGSLASTTTAATEPNLSKLRSRSLEPITGLAMWSSEPHIIELVKGERGLGFSILDYQDPMNPSETVIVIRSLVPGGVAQMDGRLIPGDRLLSVNSVALDNASLDQAVQALKGAPKGIVRIAVAKPLPIPDSVSNSQEDGTGLSEDTPTLDDHSMYSCSESMHSDVEEEKKSTSFSLSSKDILKDTDFQREGNRDYSEEKVLIMEFPKYLEQELKIVKGNKPLGLKLESVDDGINGMVVTELVPSGILFQNEKISVGDLITSINCQSLRCKTRAEVQSILEIVDSQDTEISIYYITKKEVSGHLRAQETGSPSQEIRDIQTSPRSVLKNLDPTSYLNKSRSKALSPVLSPQGFESASDKESEYVDCDWLEDRTYYGSPILIDDVTEKSSSDSVDHHKRKNISSPSCEVVDYHIKKNITPPFPSEGVDCNIRENIVFVSSLESVDQCLRDDSAPPQSEIVDNRIRRNIYSPSHSESVDYIVRKKILSPTRSESVDHHIGQNISPPTPSDSLDYSTRRHISKSVDSCAQSVSDYKPVFENVLNVEESTLSFSDDTLDSVQETKPVHRYNNNIFSRERSLESLHIFNYRVEQRPELSKGISEPILNSDNRLLANSERYSKKSEVRKRRNMTVTHSGSTALLSKHWGPQRSVKIFREPNSSLGISIVGGKVDLYSTKPDCISAISGIFIKNILPNSPAGRTGELKTGDRILEVDGLDVRQASHERAVDVIRAANNPVVLLVQSLVQQIADGESIGIVEVSSTGGGSVKGSIGEGPDPSHQTKEPSPRCETENKVEVKTEKKPQVRSGSSSEDSDEDDDYTNLEGMTRSAAGVEISRASAGNVRRSAEEAARDPEEEDRFGYTTEKVKKKYGSLAVVAEVERGANGLGISLAGHKDRTKMAVLICGLNPATLVYKVGDLQVGDEIVEVNGIIVHGRCHLNASAIIKGLPGPTFKIIALRRTSALEDLSVKPITQFPLTLQEETPEQKYSSFKGLKTVAIKKPGGSIERGHRGSSPSHQPSGQGLGIMIIEGKHSEVGQGIFISDIQEGSPAHQAGLTVGDMILAVNKDTLLGSNYETAASLLKKTEGVVSLVVCNPNIKSDDKKLGDTGFPSPGTTTPKCDKSGRQSQAGTPKLAPPPGSLSPSPSGKVKAEDENAAATAPITPGVESIIEISKEKMGLGLSIVGGSDTLLGAIVVHDIYPDGAALKDGRLRPGDQLLEVNNEDFRTATNAKALLVLRQTPSKVKMLVYREDIPDGKDEMDRLDKIDLELTKKPGKGLGLSIVGRKVGFGIFISDIIPGGVANSDGRLMKGDQILTVNGINIREMSHEEAAAILKTATGRVTLTIGRFRASDLSSRPAAESLPVQDEEIKAYEEYISTWDTFSFFTHFSHKKGTKVCLAKYGNNVLSLERFKLQKIQKSS